MLSDILLFHRGADLMVSDRMRSGYAVSPMLIHQRHHLSAQFSRSCCRVAVKGEEVLCAGLAASFIDAPCLGQLPALLRQPEYTIIWVLQNPVNRSLINSLLKHTSSLQIYLLLFPQYMDFSFLNSLLLHCLSSQLQNLTISDAPFS